MGRFRYRILVALLIVGLSALLGLSACGPRETDLSFETIEQMKGNSQLYESLEPGLVVIAQSQEVALLNGWVGPDALAQLEGLDYEAYLAVVVFQGWKPDFDFEAEIERIARRGDTVNVYAEFREPEPGLETHPEVTSPYHLVQVKKLGTWEGDITFNLVVEGAVVASLSRHFP